MSEKQVSEAGFAARRVSQMSIEDPLSPTSSSGDSISEHSQQERYNRDFPEKKLRPHLSHASSTGAIGGIPAASLHRTQTNKSVATTASGADLAFEVDFDSDDQENPQNWPLWYKGVILGIMSYATTCVVLYSTSYTSAIPGMMDSFGISDNEGILGVTTCKRADVSNRCLLLTFFQTCSEWRQELSS